MPVRRVRGTRPGSPSWTSTPGCGTASLPASGRARLRLPGHRPLRPRQRAALQPGQTPLDPYARAIAGRSGSGPRSWDTPRTTPSPPSSLDSAAFVPRSLVVDPRLRLERPPPAAHRYADTIFYEVHVKGFTMSHPDVPDGAARHLRRARPRGRHRPPDRPGRHRRRAPPGPPVVPEAFLLDRGLTNYWGYNTIGYFAPHEAYSAAVRAGRPGGQVAEFKAMVDALHRRRPRGDARRRVQPHGRGQRAGPTLCFRGLDNPAYYRLVDGRPRHYVDTTGCGNTLNAGDPLRCG